MRNLMVKFPALVVLALMLLVGENAWADGLVYVTVEGRGSAETRAQAIKEALVEALSQVNGTSIAAQDVTALKAHLSSLEIETPDASLTRQDAVLQEEQQKRIAAATKGMVKSYEVLSEAPSELKPGWVDVVVAATVGRYEASAQTQRKRIAVMPFRVRPGAPAYERRYAELAAQGVVDYLTQTRRFAVLDRDFLREKHAEFDLLQGDDIPVEERARVGNTLGTDYLVVGAVDELDGARREEKLPYVDEVQVVYDVKARMSWRIIEAPTGMVMLSDTVTEQQKKKILQNADAELPGVTTLADATAARIGRRILDTIYPLMPVAFSGDSLTIGQGGDTLRVGQRFHLIQYGEVLRDPYTKEPLGREEKSVGLVEVTSVLPKTAQAKVLECSIAPDQFEPGRFILREAPGEPAGRKPAAAPKKTMTPKW